MGLDASPVETSWAAVPPSSPRVPGPVTRVVGMGGVGGSGFLSQATTRIHGTRIKNIFFTCGLFPITVNRRVFHFLFALAFHPITFAFSV